MASCATHMEGYLGKIARTFGRAEGVRVIVGGGGGLRTNVNTKTIYIPETAASLVGTDRHAFEGGLDHEVGHIRRESEHPAGERPSDLSVGLSRVEAHFFNLTEDITLELDAADRWHGVKMNLDALRIWCAEMNRVKAAEGETDQLHLVTVGIFVRAMGQPELCNWLDPVVVNLLDAMTVEIAQATAAKTPRETLAAALAIVAKLRELAPPPPSEPEPTPPPPEDEPEEEEDEEIDEPEDNDEPEDEPGEDPPPADDDPDGPEGTPGGNDDSDDEDDQDEEDADDEGEEEDDPQDEDEEDDEDFELDEDGESVVCDDADAVTGVV